MRTPVLPSPTLTRRKLLLLFASGLSGCGGGAGEGGTNIGSLPGTGGTGIYVAGSISGFGSVILGGIKFDDTSADITVDGTKAVADDLRMGMVAEVLGERSKTLPAQGIAKSIDVWSIARGTVTGKSGGLLTVAGMSVRVDANTVLDGINDQTPLAVGMPVIVWGQQADSGTWTATRVSKVADTTTVVTTGRVSGGDDHRSINTLSLTNESATSLDPGSWVRVQGRFNDAGRLVVNGFTVLQGPKVIAGSDMVLEVEGYVTSPLVNNQFDLGQWRVDVSAIGSITSIAQGAKVAVKGTFSAGLLRATSLNVDDESVVHEVEIEARISDFKSIADFVLRGQRCDASTAPMSDSVRSRLRDGVKVKIHGRKRGEFVAVEELEISS